jgi:hypothetical protein
VFWVTSIHPFNQACTHALQEKKDAALAALQKSIELEPETYKLKAREDRDLDFLRGEEPFKKLVSNT